MSNNNIALVQEMFDKSHMDNTNVDVIKLCHYAARRTNTSICAFVAEDFLKIKEAYIYAYFENGDICQWKVENSRLVKCSGNLTIYYDNDLEIATGSLTLSGNSPIAFMFSNSSDEKYIPEFVGITRLVGVVESAHHYCGFDLRFDLMSTSANRYFYHSILDNKETNLFKLVTECVKQDLMLNNKEDDFYE